MRYFPEKPELFTENRRRFIEAMVEAGRAEAGRAPKSEGREWSGGPGREWSGRERREWSGGPGGGSGGNARKPDSGSGQGVADGRARGAGAGSGQEVADGQGGADGRARETGVGLGQGMADGPAGSSDGTTGPKAIAIFVSNDEVGSNADAHYPFRQNSDLYWLSGIWQEDTMLVLFPGHPDARYREVLVLTRPNELKEKWDGRRLRAEEARKISGIQTILWLDTIGSQLQQWIHMADSIYLNSNEHDRRTGPLLSREHRYIAEMQANYPLHAYRRSAKLLRELRAIKTPAEIGLMQQAVDITGETFHSVLRFIKPGVMEYEIEAEIYRGFLSRRSNGPAYESIIASGDRARTLHYITNNQECRGGELVLMDFGASYGGYNADLTRTVPVNGKFTARQAEVYNACLHLHRFAKQLLRPGLLPADYKRQVGEEAGKMFLKIGLLTEADLRNQTPENPAYTKYMYHGVSHHLGIDVHDVGPANEPYREGMVLTIEPGIYIEEEQLGIRIENDVWLTADGNVDLMARVPITIEEIEAVMNK